MMFSVQKNLNAFSIFKWKRQNKLSLTTSLLKDAPPEIELSEYGRLHSPGSESPSGLLNGESLNVEPIADLDLFFERVYSYYREKGLWSIMVKWIAELLTLGFTIFFSTICFLFVDWNGLRNAKCGMDAVESGMKPCDLAKEAIRQHPLTPLTISTAIIVGYLVLFSIYWIFCFLRFFAQLKDVLRIRYFYHNSLHLMDSEIQTMPWATILDKIVQLQSSQQLCVVKDLSAHEVIMRLMRKENYLIGMLNKGLLAFPLSSWVPGAGPAELGQDETHSHLILTKTLEWTLNWCILQSMFDRNFNVRRDFISNPRTLKKRLMVVGLAMLLLSPFLVIFMLVCLFLRHAEQFYHHPSTALSRRWSNLSRWMFREFNEVDHLFRHRINSSVDHASEYLKQFPSPMISIVAKFIAFVSGGFAAILIIVAFLEESLLEGHIFGRNLFWYAAVFGTITAISRAAITDELLVLDPKGAMSMVVQHTHYMPKRWRGKESTETVRTEFETLFQFTGMMLLEEMASIFLTPLLLIFVVPRQVENILQFIADFTVNIDGVGHVCSFSTFDFQRHGNSNYASPYNTARTQRSCQGKMEKSFLSFQSSYPSWEPSVQGKQFLANLRSFREQSLRGTNIGHGHTPIIWQNSNQMDAGHRNTGTWRNTPHNNTFGFHLASLWPVDEDQRTHTYILDWYHHCRCRSSSNPARSNPTELVEVVEQQDGELWIPTNLTCEEDRDEEEYWHGHTHDDRLRSQLGASTSTTFYKDPLDSQLDASTSTPFFNDSAHQHHDSVHPGQPTRSHWWARTDMHGCQTQTSFMEPPNFTRYQPDNHNENFSERSMEEEERHFDWKGPPRSWRTAYYADDDDDLEAGGSINLHFDDVYPESPAVYREQPSL